MTAPRSLCFANGMRIFAGAEVWMLEAAAGLRDRGWRVDFLAHPGGPLAEEAAAAGFDVAEIAVRGDLAPWSIAAAWRLFRRTRPDAVVCNRLKDLKVAGTAARLAGVPVVLHSRESDAPLRPGRPFYRWYLNSVATGVMVNSRATLATTIASAPWLERGRVHLLLKGVDVRRFTPASSAPVPPVVGFVGRLSRRKGLPELMAAWEFMLEDPRSPTDTRLRVAGEGELGGALEAWRRTLSRPDSVEILGRVETMPDFYRTLTVLAMPSRYEGYGLAAAEALACGVPVVACGVSSLPEIVADGVSGRLTPPGDAAALADGLLELLADSSLRDARGRAGRAAMVAGHDRGTVLDRFESLLAPASSRNP